MSARPKILEAARRLIEEEGAGVSMGRIAARAGVSRRAVYLHFDSRTRLLLDLVDHVDRAGRLAERAATVWESAAGVEALRRFVALNASYNPEIDAIGRALDLAREDDPAAAAAWEDRMAGRRKACRRIAAWIADEGNLADGWAVSDAADIIWALTNITVWHDLVVDRGWSGEKYRDHVTGILEATLTGGSA